MRVRTAVCTAVWLSLWAMPPARPADLADEIRQASGVGGGVCIQLGFTSPALMRQEVSAGVLATSTVAADGARTGELLVLSAADGSRTASVALPAAPVYEGLAVAPGRVLASLEDGSILCFGPGKSVP